jgi:hypothetical protein
MRLCPPGTYQLQSQANPLLFLGVTATGDEFVVINVAQPVTWTVEGTDFPQHLWLPGAGGNRAYLHFGQSPLLAGPLDPSAIESQLGIFQQPNGSYAIGNHDHSYIADQNGDQPSAGNPVIPWSVNVVSGPPQPNQLWILVPV